MRNRFFVFQGITHSYLRCSLMSLVLFIFYLSSQLDYIWLYAISVIFLIIAVITMSFLCSYITISDSGIKLQYGFWRCYEQRWEDILCCGTFSLKILGAVQEEEYFYFSKKPVSYRNLVTSPILPAQSNDFIFLSKQDKALISIKKYVPKFKELKNLD